MWLRNVYLRTLREHRLAILGWGVGMGVVVVSPMASVATLLSTPQSRQELVTVAATFAWNADAIAVDTIGGYATFKIGIFVFLIAIWPILVGSRMLRGEEERGSLDVLLSLPGTRTSVALQKLAAMWTALLAMAVLIGVIAYAGGRRFGAEFSPADGLLFGLDLALLCAAVGGLALLVSQFTREHRPAAGWAAGLLVVFVVLDMAHRVVPSTIWLSRLSPVYYYNLSKPLVPGHGADPAGMLVLLALAVLPSAAAVWLFAHRDVGGTVPLPRLLARPPRPASRALPVADPSLRSVFARAVATMAVATGWWTLGIAGGAAWMVFAIDQLKTRLPDLLSGSPQVSGLLATLGGGGSDVNASFLSAIFVLLPLSLMAYAAAEVNRWSADEQDGRLELVLATPQPRLRVLLARFGALGAATIVIGLATLAATGATAAGIGLALDPGRLAAASLGMIPLGLLVAAIGYLASGWLRTAADTGLLSFLLVAWFFISFIGPELSWPDATLRLSALYYYGTPLLHGLQASSVAGVVVLSALLLAAGAARFVRKDIGV